MSASTKTLVIDRPARSVSSMPQLAEPKEQAEVERLERTMALPPSDHRLELTLPDDLEACAATAESVCFDTITEDDLVHGHWHMDFGYPSGRYVRCDHAPQLQLVGSRVDVPRLLAFFSGPARRNALAEAAKKDCCAAVIQKLISDYRASRPVTFNAQVSEKEASVVAIHPQTGRIAYCFDSSSREMPALYRDQGYQRVNFKSFRTLERFCRGQGTVNDVETDCRDGLEQDYADAKRAHNKHIDDSVATVKRMRKEFERRPDHAALQRELRNFTIHHFGELTSDRHLPDERNR